MFPASTEITGRTSRTEGDRGLSPRLEPLRSPQPTCRGRRELRVFIPCRTTASKSPRRWTHHSERIPSSRSGLGTYRTSQAMVTTLHRADLDPRDRTTFVPHAGTVERVFHRSTASQPGGSSNASTKRTSAMPKFTVVSCTSSTHTSLNQSVHLQHIQPQPTCSEVAHYMYESGHYFSNNRSL